MAHVFEDAGALDQLRAFAYENGPAFYGLPVGAWHSGADKTGHTRKIPIQNRNTRGSINRFDPGFDVFGPLSKGNSHDPQFLSRRF